jgi:hypothetical protein
MESEPVNFTKSPILFTLRTANDFFHKTVTSKLADCTGRLQATLNFSSLLYFTLRLVLPVFATHSRLRRLVQNIKDYCPLQVLFSWFLWKGEYLDFIWGQAIDLFEINYCRRTTFPLDFHRYLHRRSRKLQAMTKT